MFDLKNKNISVKKSILFMIVCILTGCLLSAAVFASSPLTFQTITSGVISGASTYTVFKDNSVYYAKNQYGGIVFSSSNASSLLQSVLTIGGNIFIKAGLYDNLKTLYVYGDTRISGEGNNTILKMADNNNANLFWVVGDNNNIIFEYLCLDGNRNAQSSGYPMLIQLYDDVANIYIHNCHFQNGYSVGIDINRAYNVTIQNNLFNNFRHDAINVETQEGTAAFNIKILSNTISNCDRYAIDIWIGNALIDGNFISDIPAGNPAININTLANATIINNEVINVGSNAIQVMGEYDLIANNRLTNCGLRGVYLYNAANITVIGNVIIDTLNKGIYVSNSSWCIFSGNTFPSIQEVGGSNYNLIIGCIAKNNILTEGASSHANLCWNGSSWLT